MKSKLTKSRITLVAALVFSYLSLPILIFSTDPTKLPLPLLILPVVLVFLIFFLTTFVLLTVFRPGMRSTKMRTISVSSAILPTLLVVLQSIQQLDVKDVLIAGGLWLLLVWYLQRVEFF